MMTLGPERQRRRPWRSWGRDVIRSRSVLALFALAALLSILTLAAPDEATGIVTNVVDGDTFDVAIEQADLGPGRYHPR